MTPVDTGLSSGKDGRKDDARSALQRRSLQSSILLKAAAMQIAWQLFFAAGRKRRAANHHRFQIFLCGILIVGKSDWCRIDSIHHVFYP